MPAQFTGNVEAPKDMQFGADSFVDSSNSLEGLEEAAKAFETATSTLVKKSLTDDILAEDALNQSRYEQIRRTKKSLYDAADSRDEAGVVKFGKQLEELTIAENQGAISGTNASIRRESLLRSYVNRFPHREEEIRQLYSHTRAQLQAGRAEKVSDPIEDGINDVLSEAVKKGKSPIQVLEDRQHEDFMNRAALDATYNAALGNEIAPQLTQAFDQHAIPIFYSQATDYITLAMNMAQQGNGDVDAVTIKRNLEMQKIAARAKVSETVNNILRASPEPGATLPKDFINEQVAKVDAIYDGMIKYADNVDTLTAYARGLEYTKNKSIADMRKVSPMLGKLIDIGAVEYAGKFLAEDFPQVAQVYYTQGRAGLQALLNNAPTPMEKARLKLQMHMLGDGYEPEEQAEDLGNMIETGAPPTRTGDPYVDAVRLSALSDTVLKSSNTPPEAKDNAGVSILEAEKSDSAYLGPGSHWYKNPVHLNALTRSEPLKARLREEITGTAASVTRKLSEMPDVANGLLFVPDLERDQKEHKYPWKAYPTGGPFAFQGQEDAEKLRQSTGGDPRMEPAMEQNPVTRNFAAIKSVVDTLNNAYWIIRRIDGAPKAEEWASQILSQRDADQEANAADQAGEDESFDQPTFDLTD